MSGRDGGRITMLIFLSLPGRFSPVFTTADDFIQPPKLFVSYFIVLTRSPEDFKTSHRISVIATGCRFLSGPFRRTVDEFINFVVKTDDKQFNVVINQIVQGELKNEEIQSNLAQIPFHHVLSSIMLNVRVVYIVCINIHKCTPDCIDW